MSAASLTAPTPDGASAGGGVLFSSASVGAGHNQAAYAVMAALAEAAPSVQMEFIDTLAHVPAWFRMAYGGGYALMAARLPWLYGLGYRLSHRPTGSGRACSEKARLAVEWRVNRRFRQHLLRRRPALVVATHHMVLPVIGRMIAEGVEGLRLWAVVTDHEAHRFWYGENVERYFVGDDSVVEDLRRWDVPADRITVSGIPVHPKWTAPLERERILRDWRLPADRPIVVVTGGAHFTVGPVPRIARRIAETTGAYVMVLAGSNKKLAARLASMSVSGGTVVPVGFTDRCHELAEVATLIVTKAGGITTSECIAKGVPMVLSRSGPGQETANVELLCRRGAAVPAPTPRQVVRTVTDLLGCPDKLAQLSRNARALYRPAAQAIAHDIAETIQT